MKDSEVREFLEEGAEEDWFAMGEFQGKGKKTKLVGGFPGT